MNRRVDNARVDVCVCGYALPFVLARTQNVQPSRLGNYSVHIL